MLEKIGGISIKGAMFHQETNLSIFQKTSQRMAIIYGKNGSGKSTISRAFSYCKNVDESFNISAHLLGLENNPVVLTDSLQDSIFIFNEDYIQNNVRLRQDGLDTIVLLGEWGELEEKIIKATQNINDTIEAQNEQEELCNRYNESTSLLSPEYHYNQMRCSLQGDSSWAGKDSFIRGGKKTNSPVNDTIIAEISSLNPTRPKNEVLQEFEEQLILYKQVIADGEKITNDICTIEFSVSETDIINALSKKIEEPVLSEREKNLFTLVDSEKQTTFEDISSYFSSEKNICPFCLQQVSEDHKKYLFSFIEKILTDSVDAHKKELNELFIKTITFDKSNYEKIAKAEGQVEKCLNVITELNSIIEQYDILLNKKLSNIYVPITCEPLGLEETIDIVNKELSVLDCYIAEYNNSIGNKANIQKQLLKLNKELAYFDLQEHKKQYEICKNKREEEYKKLKTLISLLSQNKQELASLISKKKDIKIAVNYINRGLQYVFFSPNRLKISVEDDKYLLFSHGNPVKPSDVSCGERNIIALCYFFTQIMNNQNESEMYTKECLIVIDDPVSSFDLENRIGILSYLKSQMLKIILNNENSKIILMSHDLGTVFDIEKAISEIKNAGEKIYGCDSTDKCIYMLNNKNIENFSYNRNEYSLLLESVFQFASGDTKNDLTIGNIMRRVLEAFSTFEYKMGIGEISCSKNILRTLGDERYSEYFENLMFRLVLDGESHSQDRVKIMQDPNFFNTISIEEKQQTAKDILCFILLLNRKHLEAHLKSIPKSIETIDKWCEEILK